MITTWIQPLLILTFHCRCYFHQFKIIRIMVIYTLMVCSMVASRRHLTSWHLKLSPWNNTWGIFTNYSLHINLHDFVYLVFLSRTIKVRMEFYCSWTFKFTQCLCGSSCSEACFPCKLLTFGWIFVVKSVLAIAAQ